MKEKKSDVRGCVCAMYPMHCPMRCCGLGAVVLELYVIDAITT